MSFDLSGIKIGVLAGGVSAERQISLESGAQAHQAFVSRGIDSVFIDIVSRSAELVKEQLASCAPDVAFIALHGEFGEDGGIQSILESIDMPYTGSQPEASFLAMNKIASKEVFMAHNIPTAPYRAFTRGEAVAGPARYPVVVKPYGAGSSIGISIAYDDASLRRAIEAALLVQDRFLIEEFIEGREFTVGIFEERALAVVEIAPHAGYFDFTTKYSDGMADFIVPAKLDPAAYHALQDAALAAHQALGCRHFSRVDIRLDRNMKPYVLEVNSIPGLTSHSLLPLSARACGISFNELVTRMVGLALYGKTKTQEVKKN